MMEFSQRKKKLFYQLNSGGSFLTSHIIYMTHTPCMHSNLLQLQGVKLKDLRFPMEGTKLQKTLI